VTPILPILGIAFFGLAVVWPLSFFGYRYYRELVDAEEARHAAEGKH
jgi:hypothetical protein